MRISIISFFILITVFFSEVQALDQAQKALYDARNYARNGEYDKALERYVWFHNNALRIRPGYYGVRLSFALMDWVRLGKKYPEAMVKLKSIRDQKVSRLIEGELDRELFHDVEAINDHIGEMDLTVKLFMHFDQVNPDFCESIYSIADDSLFEFRKYSLARKYMGDPKTRLNDAKQVYQSGLEFAKSKNNHLLTLKSYERIFTGEVIRIVTILDKTGERESALEIKAEALEILYNIEINNLLL